MADFKTFLKESVSSKIQDEPKSEAATEAKKLGLTYVGFGRYADREGNVKYIVVNKKLVAFKSSEDIETNKTKAKEERDKASDKEPAAKAKEKAKGLENEAKGGENAQKELEKQGRKFKREAAKEVLDTHKKLIKMYRPELFTDQEIAALQGYSSTDFTLLNRYLYKGFDPEMDTNSAQGLVAEVEALDAAFEESGAPFDYTIYTGLSARYNFQKMKINTPYTFRGYVSGSLDTNVASDAFTSAGPWGDNPEQIATMLEIDIKAGQKSIYMGNFAEDPKDFETVLPRGTKIIAVSGPDIVDSALIANYGPEKIAVFKCQIVDE